MGLSVSFLSFAKITKNGISPAMYLHFQQFAVYVPNILPRSEVQQLLLVIHLEQQLCLRVERRVFSGLA